MAPSSSSSLSSTYRSRQVCDRVGEVFNPAIRQQLGLEWHLLNAEQRRRLAVDILNRCRAC